MSMKYLRNTYGIPARRGGRVRFTDQDGVVWNGRITSTLGPYLRVLVDDRVPGYRRRLVLHPTWQVEYVTPNDLS
jgi:hypothetical protein